MVEFGSQELAREFYEDSTHIKAHRDHPLTLEEYEDSRQRYLDDHPAYRGFVFKSSASANPAPTLDEVQQGTYIHDRWRT